MVDFLKKCGAIGLLLMSSMGVYAAEEEASGGPAADGAAGGITTGAAVALGVLHQALPQGFVIDTPLLGAGAAGAPPHEAAAVAALAVEYVAEDSQRWPCESLTLRFIVRETAGSFVRALQILGASELPDEPPQ